MGILSDYPARRSPTGNERHIRALGNGDIRKSPTGCRAIVAYKESDDSSDRFITPFGGTGMTELI
jgi:hypothetical protein